MVDAETRDDDEYGDYIIDYHIWNNHPWPKTFDERRCRVFASAIGRNRIHRLLGVDRITAWKWANGQRRPTWAHMELLRRLVREEDLR